MVANAVAPAGGGGGGGGEGQRVKRKWTVRVRKDVEEAGESGGWKDGDALPGGTRPCNAALQQLARRGDVRGVMRMLESMDEASVERDVYTYNAALNACCKRGKSQGRAARGQIEGLMRDMLERGVEPTIVTFNTMLKGAAQAGDVAWAEAVMDAMRGAKVQGDHITYSTLVNACAVGGDVAKAMGYLDEMMEVGVTPTESTLTSLIRGCEWAGDVASAKRAYEHRTRDMSTSVIISMADCLTACGRAQQALELLGVDLGGLGEGKGGEALGGKWDPRILNSALKAMRSMRDVASSMRLLEAACLVEGGVAPDAISLNIVTDTCCLAGDLALARECISALHHIEPSSSPSASSPPPCLSSDPSIAILRSVASLVRPRCPHTHQYNSLIRAVGYAPPTSSVRGGDGEEGDGGGGDSQAVDECFGLVQEMRDRKIAVDAVVLTTLVDVCAHRGAPERAAEVLELLGSDGGVDGGGVRGQTGPSVATYNALIKAYRSAGRVDEAVGVFERMKEAGVGPDEVSYNTLLDATLMKGGTDANAQSLDLIQRMKEEGMTPDTTTYNTLIKGYGRSKQLPKAMQVLRDMQQQGMEPDQKTYSTLAEACGNVGDVARVMEMRDRMGVNAPRELELACREALIKAHAVVRDVDGAENAFGDLERDGLVLSTKGYAALMDAYANAGEPYKVMDCIDQMRQRGNQPNKVHYSTQIESPDAVCFNIVLHAAIRTQDLDVLVNVLRIMEQSGVPPDAQTQAALDRAGSTAASLKVGAVLNTFSKGFKSRVFSGIGLPNKIATTISGVGGGTGSDDDEVPHDAQA